MKPYPILNSIVLSRLAKPVRKINDFIFKGLVFIITKLLPSKHWYKSAFLITVFSQFKIVRIVVKKESLHFLRARDLNKLLALLTRSGKAFPIPYNPIQFPAIEHSSGLILCTVHLPLAKVAIRAFLEKQHIIDAAIVGYPTKDNRMAVWGLTEKIQALLRSPSVLIKAKSILSKNGRVVLMIDNGDGKSVYSPNIMHLCGKVGAKIIFFFAELKQDGTIDTSFVYAPKPYCKTEAEILENLDFLRFRANEIFSRYNYLSITQQNGNM